MKSKSTPPDHYSGSSGSVDYIGKRRNIYPAVIYPKGGGGGGVLPYDGGQGCVAHVGGFYHVFSMKWGPVSPRSLRSGYVVLEKYFIETGTLSLGMPNATPFTIRYTVLVMSERSYTMTATGRGTWIRTRWCVVGFRYGELSVNIIAYLPKYKENT